MWKALKIKILEWGILIFENMFFERGGVKNVFAFFLENVCHADRVALNASRFLFSR